MLGDATTKPPSGGIYPLYYGYISTSNWNCTSKYRDHDRFWRPTHFGPSQYFVSRSLGIKIFEAMQGSQAQNIWFHCIKMVKKKKLKPPRGQHWSKVNITHVIMGPCPPKTFHLEKSSSGAVISVTRSIEFWTS